MSAKSPFQIGDTDRCAITEVTDLSSYGEVPLLLEGCLLLSMSEMLDPFHARIYDAVALSIDVDGADFDISGHW